MSGVGGLGKCNNLQLLNTGLKVDGKKFVYGGEKVSRAQVMKKMAELVKQGQGDEVANEKAAFNELKIKLKIGQAKSRGAKILSLFTERHVKGAEKTLNATPLSKKEQINEMEDDIVAKMAYDMPSIKDAKKKMQTPKGLQKLILESSSDYLKDNERTGVRNYSKKNIFQLLSDLRELKAEDEK